MFFDENPVTLDSGLTGEPLRIQSANPLNFYQAISQFEQAASVEIFGQLFFPKDGNTKAWPVVVVVPGSLGVAPSHLAKAEMLCEAGIATCVIDPFGARRVASTVANQAQYSFAASAWDVLATVALLAGREDIDQTRIGVQGHSRGGSAVLSAACMAQLIMHDGAYDIHGVYAAYPWSGQQFARPFVGETVVRAVIGDQDEWCLPQQVQAHINAIKLCGGSASCKIFLEAHHSFDRDTAVELVEDASVSPGAPTVYIREDGAMFHPLSEEADPALFERDLMIYSMKSGYGKKGARIGSAGNQAALFHKDMLDFWTALM